MAQGVLYTVRADCPDEATAERYAAWLLGGHAAAVVAGGARSATVVRLDAADGAGPRRVVEVRYAFEARGALERYLREFAPALRAEGLALFGPQTGVRLERSVGEVAGEVVGEVSGEGRRGG